MPNMKPKIRIAIDLFEPEYLEVKPLNYDGLIVVAGINKSTPGLLRNSGSFYINLLGRPNRINALHILTQIQDFCPRYKCDRITWRAIREMYFEIIEGLKENQTILVVRKKPIKMSGRVEYSEARDIISCRTWESLLQTGISVKDGEITIGIN